MNDVSEKKRYLTDNELNKIHLYWNACNYIEAGTIYLKDNFLLKKPLKSEHIKKRLLGHWG
jgi:xylulose-5-phosphate/fructose-6-phosphate phosphoketolase